MSVLVNLENQNRTIGKNPLFLRYIHIMLTFGEPEFQILALKTHIGRLLIKKQYEGHTRMKASETSWLQTYTRVKESWSNYTTHDHQTPISIPN